MTEAPECPFGSAGRSGLAGNSGALQGCCSCSCFHFVSRCVLLPGKRRETLGVSRGKRTWELDIPHSQGPRVCPCGAGELPGFSRSAVYISPGLGVYSVLLAKFGGLFVPLHQPQHGRRHRAPHSLGYVRTLGGFISLYLDALGFSEGRSFPTPTPVPGPK